MKMRPRPSKSQRACDKLKKCNDLTGGLFVMRQSPCYLLIQGRKKKGWRKGKSINPNGKEISQKRIGKNKKRMRIPQIYGTMCFNRGA